MRELIQRTIDVLKIRVKKNLELISANQKLIKQLIDEPKNIKRSTEFERYYDANKKMLQENNDYINIQLTLINFIEKYKGTAVIEESMPIVDIYSITDEGEVFELTLKGIVTFDEKHPRFHDTNFIDRLITHFKTIEEYEKCQELKELKSKLV
jgi:uncharacterized protein YjgD (DUF1641 family)